MVAPRLDPRISQQTRVADPDPGIVRTYILLCPGSSDPQEKNLIYLHPKMRFIPLINYNDTLG